MSSSLRILLFSFICLISPRLGAQTLKADFTANTTSGCAPLVVQFTDISTGSPTSFHWDLGNGDTSYLENPSTSYSKGGTYTVTLRVTNSSGTSTKTYTNLITVYDTPVVSFTATPKAGCPPLTVSFTDGTTLGAPGTGKYQWDFGDGSSSIIRNPTKTFNLSNYYSISLQVTNSKGCVHTETYNNYIDVYTPPTGSFSAATTHFCSPPAHAVFTGTGSGTGTLIYNWSFGTTGSSTSYNYTSYGSFDVKLVITDSNGCKDTIFQPNYIDVSKPTAGFTGPSSACVNTNVSFANTSSPSSASPYWDFGDGHTSYATNGSNTYTTAGTYTVTLVSSQSGCSDTTKRSITIYPAPTPTITYSPNPPCPAPVTINFTASTATGTTSKWDFGDGSPAGTGTTYSHTYTTDGSFIVTLKQTTLYGCVFSVSDTLDIANWQLQIVPSKDSGCSPLSVFFTEKVTTTNPSYGLYPYKISKYYWDFGDGTSDTAKTPTHIFSTGTFKVKLTITMISGCSITDSTIIIAGTKPHVGFYKVPHDTACVHQAVYFYDTSSGSHITGYNWDFDGNGYSSVDQNPVTKYGDTGWYYIKHVADYNGCGDTTKDSIYIKGARATIKMKGFCGLTRTFYDTASYGYSSHIWFFSDGGSSTLDSPIHTFPDSNTYKVTLVVFSSVTGCSDTTFLPVPIYTPSISLKAITDTAICKGGTVTFQAQLKGAPLPSFVWYVDYGIIIGSGGGSIFTDTFKTVGYHTIGVYALDPDACPYDTTMYHYVSVVKPVAAFTASPLSGCAPLTVNFTDQSRDTNGAVITTRNWMFGDGSSTTVHSATASHTYPNGGIDSVVLIVTDTIGCSDTLTKRAYISVYQPRADFSADNTIPCRYIPVNFTNNTSAGTYRYSKWDFGDGSSDTATNPSHAYKDTGYFTVRLIVTDVHGCVDTLIKPNYIYITNPHASFTMSDSVRICPALIVNFTNTSKGATNYYWDLGNTKTSYLTNPVNTYGTSGYFTVMLVAIDNHGCSDTAYGHVNIFGYTGGLTYTPLLGCNPLTVNFTSTITVAPYALWDFSDGYTSSVSGSLTTTHTYTHPGKYVPKLILGDGKGCKSENTGADTIKVDAVIAGFKPTTPCQKTIAELIDTSFSYFSPLRSWTWLFEDGSTKVGPYAFHYYGAPGYYPITLYVMNGNGCKDTLTDSIYIYPPPSIGAGSDTIICLGDAATLYPSGGVSYVWSPAGTLSCSSCTNPLASPTVPTTYTVVGTDAHGCFNSDSVTVSIQTKTTSIADTGGAICQGKTLQLWASGAQVYTWTPSNSLDSNTIATPLASPDSTTNYMVVAKEGSCIPDTNYALVTVYPLPTVKATYNETIVAGQSVILHATGSRIISFDWSPDSTLSCSTCSDPTATPYLSTTYTVKVSSIHGCLAEDSVHIKVLCDKSLVFVPNSFTPNGDGENDIFYPRGVGISVIKSFRVYNRWGEVVFERTNINVNDESTGWDGTYQGAKQKPDVYVYLIDAVCDSGEEIKWKGDVTIIH